MLYQRACIYVVWVLWVASSKVRNFSLEDDASKTRACHRNHDLQEKATTVIVNHYEASLNITSQFRRHYRSLLATSTMAKDYWPVYLPWSAMIDHHIKQQIMSTAVTSTAITSTIVTTRCEPVLYRYYILLHTITSCLNCLMELSIVYQVNMIIHYWSIIRHY